MWHLNTVTSIWLNLFKGSFLGYVVIFVLWLSLPMLGRANADQVNATLTTQTASEIWFSTDSKTALAPKIPLTVTLSISHTEPVMAGFPAYFEIETQTSGTSNIFPESYTWIFDDGRVAVLTNTEVISHTYREADIYNLVLNASGAGFDQVTINEALNVIEPNKRYLPLIYKGFVPPETDLTCQLTIVPKDITAADVIQLTVLITSTNAISESFWVDLYINPTKPITLNVPWGNNCAGTGPEDTTHCLGIAWDVDATKLTPNEPFALASVPQKFHPGGFDEMHTNWPGILSVGNYTVTALVDSINHATDYGALNELDEKNNSCASPALTFTVNPTPSLKSTENSIKQAPGRYR